jgi:RNA polymerase sigma-54 factor
MKQSIHIHVGTQLTMTPQLQQAIHLLQLSTLELQMEVQQVLESNLMLEVVENEEDTIDSEALATPGETHEVEQGAENPERELDVSGETIPEELPVDSTWDDIYDGGPAYSEPADSEARDFLDTQGSIGETLQDHLTWQMQLTPFTDTDRAIATAIIDAVNEDGYLGLSLEEIHESIKNAFEVELEEVETVLHRVQRFDPVGVAGRDLGECLLLQLEQLDPNTPWLQEARILIRDHLHMLGNHHYTQLRRRMKLSESALTEVIALIRSLNPRPGAQIAKPAVEYIIPDVFVRKVEGLWRLELNSETAPRLRINPHYQSLIRRADNSADNSCLKNHLQEAKWFLKSLRSRNETLLKVGCCIVERQRGFLDYGEEAMRPLVLREVAEALDMHESTISRITTQKYMHTPRGIFEFKYFFSSHLSTADGGECSSTAIRAMIKKLIAAEDPAKPLSDNKLTEVLLKNGINVARRTVAKYREVMSIPTSNERKRLT